VFLLPRGDDFDIWWHLKYGEHFITNLTMQIDHAAYSWTPADGDWTYVTWLGSALIYIFYYLGSFTGVYLAIVASLLAIYAMQAYYLRRSGQKIETWHIASMAFLPLMMGAIYLKPEYFSFSLWGLCLFIYFFAKIKSYRLFALYPPLFIVWVNTHGLFLVGLILVAALFFCEVAVYLFRKKEAMSYAAIKYFFIVSLLSLAAIFINPYGTDYASNLLANFLVNDYMDDAKYLIAFLKPYQFLSGQLLELRLIPGVWYLVVMFIVLVLVHIIRYKQLRELSFPTLAVNIIFFLFCINVSRMIPLYPILWCFSIFSLTRNLDLTSYVKKISIASAIIILIFSLSHINRVMTFDEKRTWFAINYESWFPANEVNFIREYKIPAPILNDYMVGGYLIWKLYPEYKVFIDSRYGPYVKSSGPDWFRFRANPSIEAIEQMRTKYGFNSIVLNYRDSVLILNLLKSANWKLVFFSSQAVVFVRSEMSVKTLQINDIHDLSANRFNGEDNPISLINIFKIYAQRNNLDDMNMILGIYKRNIPFYYAMKEKHIFLMTSIINSKTN
jgi:hypothetical protein